VAPRCNSLSILQARPCAKRPSRWHHRSRRAESAKRESGEVPFRRIRGPRKFRFFVPPRSTPILSCPGQVSARPPLMRLGVLLFAVWGRWNFFCNRQAGTQPAHVGRFSFQLSHVRKQFATQSVDRKRGGHVQSERQGGGKPQLSGCPSPCERKESGGPRRGRIKNERGPTFFGALLPVRRCIMARARRGGRVHVQNPMCVVFFCFWVGRRLE